MLLKFVILQKNLKLKTSVLAYLEGKLLDLQAFLARGGQKLQRCCLEVKCRTQEKFYMKVFCRKTSRQQRPSVQDLRFAQKTGVWTVLFPI